MSATPTAICAFALHRARFCVLPDGHPGDHAPTTHRPEESPDE